jgi:hypothetical protein
MTHHTQAVSRYRAVFPAPPHRTVHEVFPHTALLQASSLSIQRHIVATSLVIGTILLPHTSLAESRSFRIGVCGAPRNTAIAVAI